MARTMTYRRVEVLLLLNQYEGDHTIATTIGMSTEMGGLSLL